MKTKPTMKTSLLLTPKSDRPVLATLRASYQTAFDGVCLKDLRDKVKMFLRCSEISAALLYRLSWI